jgi:hypothetical protein
MIIVITILFTYQQVWELVYRMTNVRTLDNTHEGVQYLSGIDLLFCLLTSKYGN